MLRSGSCEGGETAFLEIPPRLTKRQGVHNGDLSMPKILHKHIVTGIKICYSQLKTGLQEHWKLASTVRPSLCQNQYCSL